MKQILEGLLPIGLNTLGIFALIGGELDDSPGLGGIGLILIVFATYISIKNVKNKE